LVFELQIYLLWGMLKIVQDTAETDECCVMMEH